MQRPSCGVESPQIRCLSPPCPHIVSLFKLILHPHDCVRASRQKERDAVSPTKASVCVCVRHFSMVHSSPLLLSPGKYDVACLQMHVVGWNGEAGG